MRWICWRGPVWLRLRIVRSVHRQPGSESGDPCADPAGHGQTLWVMIQGLVQTLLVRLPLAYIMSIQPDASLTQIGFAAPAATICGIVLNVVFYARQRRRENCRLG